jgi:hypothetical protein
MMVMAAFRSSVVKYLRHRVWVPRPRTTCVDDYLSLRTERVLSAKKFALSARSVRAIEGYPSRLDLIALPATGRTVPVT